MTLQAAHHLGLRDEMGIIPSERCIRRHDAQRQCLNDSVEFSRARFIHIVSTGEQYSVVRPCLELSGW